jgi:hypothetical protein
MAGRTVVATVGLVTSSTTAPDGRARRTTYAAYTALGWVVLFFAFHVYWYLGGSFASPGELPPLTPGSHSAAAGSAHARVQLVAWIVEIPVDSAWPIGALVCLAIARGWALGRFARATKVLVRVGCAVLLLRGGAGVLDDLTRATGMLANGITGLSLEATTGHAHLRWSDWAIDTYFLAGGVIFMLLAVHHRAQPTRPGRRSARGPAEEGIDRNEVVEVIGAAPTSAASLETGVEPRAQQPVPRWAERLAHLIPLMVLPSGLWRLAVALGFSMGEVNGHGGVQVVRGWPSLYIVFITLVAEAVSLTAFGLVRPLGEEVPRWLPYFGGRAVRPKSVIRAATAGSTALMLIWTLGFWDVWAGNWNYSRSTPAGSPFWAAVFAICYAPLNLWGPALLMLTWAYRRRTGPHGPDERGRPSPEKWTLTCTNVGRADRI